MSEQTLKRLLYAAVGCTVFLFVFPFLYPANGHDAWIHLNWLDQFTTFFRDGNLYPRWMPDSFSGFGSPAFYYYPPLSYWVAGILSFILPSSSHTLYYGTIISTSFLSGYTMYLFLREVQKEKKIALIGTLLYLVTSYRFLLIYKRFAFGEHVGFIFLPLILLGIEYSFLKRNERSLFFSAIGWGGLLLTNIPLSIMMVLALPVYTAIRFGKNVIRFSALPAMGPVLGLLIAAIYLLPALSFDEYVKQYYLWGHLSPHHFLDTIIPDVIQMQDIFFRMSNAFFTVCAAILCGTFFLHRHLIHSEGKRNVYAFATLVFVILILQLSFTEVIWNETLLRFVQFPWRLNAIIALTLPILFVLLTEMKVKVAHWVASFVIVVSIVTPILFLALFHTVKQPDYEKYRNDPPEYVTKYAGNDPFNVQDTFARHRNDSFITPMLVSGFEVAYIKRKSEYDNEYTFHYTARTPVEVTFRLQYYPLWELREVNGDIVILKSNTVGFLSAELSPGKHTYVLSLRKSSEEKTGALISGVALAATMIIGVFAFRKKKRVL